MANGQFNSLLDGAGLTPKTSGHNISNPLPSGVQADMTLPEIGLISSGFPGPQVSPATTSEGGVGNFGLQPSSGKGSSSGGSSNLLDSPFDAPLKARG